MSSITSQAKYNTGDPTKITINRYSRKPWILFPRNSHAYVLIASVPLSGAAAAHFITARTVQSVPQPCRSPHPPIRPSCQRPPTPAVTHVVLMEIFLTSLLCDLEKVFFLTGVLPPPDSVSCTRFLSYLRRRLSSFLSSSSRLSRTCFSSHSWSSDSAVTRSSAGEHSGHGRSQPGQAWSGLVRAGVRSRQIQSQRRRTERARTAGRVWVSASYKRG